MATLEQMKDVVQKSLADRGILGQLRAQVRAAVYTVIDDTERKEGVHMENPRLQQLIGSDEGAFLVGIIDDFCKYYGMSFTRSTMHSETSSICNSHPGDVAQWAGLAQPGEADPPLLVSLVRAARQASVGGSATRSALRMRDSADEAEVDEDDAGERSGSASFASDGEAGPGHAGHGGMVLSSTIRPGTAGHSSLVAPAASDSATPPRGLARVTSGSGLPPAESSSVSASPESLSQAMRDADRADVSASPDFAISHSSPSANASSPAHSGHGRAAGGAASSPSSSPPPAKSRTGELGLKIDFAQVQGGETAPDAVSRATAGVDATHMSGGSGSSGVEQAATTDDALERMLAEATSDSASNWQGANAGFGGDATASDSTTWHRSGVEAAEPPVAPPKGGLTASSSLSELPPLPGTSPAKVTAPELPQADAPAQAGHTADAHPSAGVADDSAEEIDDVEDDYEADDYEDDFDDADHSEQHPRTAAAPASAPAPAPLPAPAEEVVDSFGAAGDDDIDFDGDDLDDMLDDIEEGALEADLGGDEAELSMGDSRSLDRSVGHGAGRGGEVVDASFVADGPGDDELQLDDAEFDADFEL